MLRELIVFDTNVYLDLYSYSEEAVIVIIDSLEKYSFWKMYITQQIYDEFIKNYIKVKNVPTLNSVYCIRRVINSNGSVVNFLDLKVGDTIKIYYYKLYQDYVPIDIKVDNIKID